MPKDKYSDIKGPVYLTLDEPSKLFKALSDILSEVPDKKVIITLDEIDYSLYDVLAYHDIVYTYKNSLDIHVEFLYNVTANALSIFAPLPVVKRKMLPSAMVLFYDNTQWGSGKVTELVIDGLELDRIRVRAQNNLADGSSLTQEKISTMTKAREYVEADAAIKAGLIGGILDV